MSSPLKLIRPGSEKLPITVSELMHLLRIEAFDRKELEVRTMREAYDCPPTVKDHIEFQQRLFDFYDHYHKWFWGGNHRSATAPNLTWDALRRLYKKDLGAVERDVILGRRGGLMAVINELTDGITKLHIESYIDLIFFDYIPEDHYLRLRLAQELLSGYGQTLFPNEELLPDFIFAGNIETVLKQFAMDLNRLRLLFRH